MQALLVPLARKLVPLMAGVMVGGWFVGLPLSLGAVANGDCQTFRGVSSGNDPTQQVVLNLCRRGDRVEGVKTSEGDAGRSVYALEGTLVDDETLQLTISVVLDDEPAAGWVSCTDDVFHLTWDAKQQALVGDYVSAECEDRAALLLARKAPVRKSFTCGSR